MGTLYNVKIHYREPRNYEQESVLHLQYSMYKMRLMYNIRKSSTERTYLLRMCRQDRNQINSSFEKHITILLSHLAMHLLLPPEVLQRGAVLPVRVGRELDEPL